MKKKILISGSSGYIGTALVKKLKKKKIFYSSIKTKKILKKDFGRNISHFIHLGFDTRKENCNIKYQLEIIKKIISSSKHFNFKIIFFSTSCGGKKNKRKLFKNNNYQIAKFFCERELFKNKRFKIDFAILRIFNLYGPKQEKKNIIPDIKVKILNAKNNKIKIIHPKTCRDFLFIDDLIDLILKCIKQKKLNNEVYEVGTGVGTSLEKVYKEVRNILKKNIEFEYHYPLYDKVRYTKAYIGKTKKKFRWKPYFKLKKGLEKIL